MAAHLQSGGKALSGRSFTPAPTVLLQRKCACGGHTIAGGVCGECSRKKQALQRKAADRSEASEVPPIVHKVLRSPGQPLEPRFGHDFSRIRIHTDVNDTLPVSQNAAVDSEPIDDEPDSGESGQVPPGQLLPPAFEESPPMGEEQVPGVERLEEGGAKKKKCPSKTVVDKTIDMTPDGIKKGYRTGYGAAAVMRVEPDSTNWDGTQIVESLKQTKNTCPKEFGISPCSGNSTFTVGAESKSSVLGALEAKRNRFYDFHISRWNKGSLLHDRNPGNVDSCQVECEQSYSCGDAVIGKHTVNRTFTKGQSGSRDVTLVAVTKS